MPDLHALLVGIDRYPNFPAEKQLTSCVQDTERMASALRERFGFRAENLLFRRDAEATRDGILAGLDDLRSRVREGDVAVFYYSGHGSEALDTTDREPDARSQTIVPHDSGRDPHPNRDITDVEIYDRVMEIGAVSPNVVVIADTCYSGGVVRDAPWSQVKRVEPGVLPAPLRAASRLPPPTSASGLRDVGVATFLPGSDRYVLLAACRRWESARVLKERRVSVYTDQLCEVLGRLPEGSTYRDLHELVRVAVNSAYPDQTPQIEGARDRQLFGGGWRRPDPFLPVDWRAEARVELGGGQAHGVMTGSLWGIYPPGTLEPGDGDPLARVRIDRVGALWSAGEVEGSPRQLAEVAPGCRAFEEDKGSAWMRLSVAVEEVGLASSGEREGLLAALRKSPVLRLETDRTRAAVTILAADSLAAGGDARAASRASWEVRGSDGGLLLSPQPRRQPMAAGDLAQLLDREARARSLRRLEKPPQDANALAACLQVRLGKRGKDGNLVEVEDGSSKGEIVFQEGDPLALEIVHTAGIPLYVHVLDIGVTGNRCSLYPPPGKNAALSPNRPLRVDEREGRELRLSVPDDLPAPLTGGREVLKIFATVDEADLSSWESTSIRGGPPPRAPRGSLRALLARAHGTPVLREGPAAEGESEQWTVLTRSFWVERRGNP